MKVVKNYPLLFKGFCKYGSGGIVSESPPLPPAIVIKSHGTTGKHTNAQVTNNNTWLEVATQMGRAKPMTAETCVVSASVQD